MSAGSSGAVVAVKAISGGWIKTALAWRVEPPLADGDVVVVQTDAGPVLAEVVARPSAWTARRPATEQSPRILRRATDQDQALRQRHEQREREAFRVCVMKIRERGLAMKLTRVEQMFDGSRLVFFFTSDDRVDFRELVRELASDYKTRIELRQIGVRDEARRVDGYGICGRRQCCNTFIGDFAPISTSHAREQDLSLNPTKISGNCGRLLCCLRYEVEQYAVNRKRFPRVGSTVETVHGPGTIERIDYFREEAVLTNAEGVSFRAKQEEIVRVQAAPGREPHARRVIAEGIPTNGEISDEEALKRLDEPEGLN